MNIDQLRNETKGTNHVIHLNNAGASLIAAPVKMAVQEYQDYEELHGGYETERHFGKELKATYDSAANFINANPEEIALMESATTAWGAIFYSLPFSRGDIILTSSVEYASNYIPYLQVQKRYGVEIRVVPNDHYGQVDVAGLEGLITPRVKLISITHIPTNSGLVNPIEEIGSIAKKHDILYLVDACQSLGQYPLDVEKIQCDFLSATGRKFLRGPRGTGFLYVRKSRIDQIEPWLLDLHGATWTGPQQYQIQPDATRFETWESNPANQLGFKAAVDYATSIGIENIWNRVTHLADQLRDILNQINGVELYNPGRVKCGIVTFSTPTINPVVLQRKLDDRGINVSVVGSENTFLDSQEHNLGELVRASVHYYNTPQELEIFVDNVTELIGSG